MDDFEPTPLPPGQDAPAVVPASPALAEADAPVTLPAPAVVPVSVAAASSIAMMIDGWVADCVHNSPIAQATEAYNHLITRALPELLRRFTGDIVA